jgi:DNA repair exonuclease SbcCD ATPase subunit
MWIPVSLKLTNFRSIVDDKIEFENGKTFLLQGVNLSDDGSDSNGSGKSSYREALVFVLGLPPYCDTLTDLINDGAETSDVELIMFNSITSDILSIERTLSRKGPSKVKIELNSVDQKDFYSTVPEANKYLLKLIGLTSEDILNHFLISKEKFVSFFSSSDNDKKALINRFSKADKLDGIDKLIQVDIDKKITEKSILNDERNKLEGKIQTYQEEIDTINSVDESEEVTELNTSIEEIKVAIESIETTILNSKKSQDIHKKKLTEVQNKIKTKEELKKKQESQVEELRKVYTTSFDELSEYKTFLSEISVSLSGVVKCPNCANEFNPGEEIDVEEARSQKPVIEETIDILSKDLKTKESSINIHKETVETLSLEIRGLKREEDGVSNDLRNIDRLILSNEKLIDSQNSEIRKIEAQIEELQKYDKLVKIKEYEAKIEECQKLINITNKKISDIDLEILSLREWVARFVRFKSHLANKSLSNIQGLSNSYLNKMKTNLGLRLEGFKQNKDGSIKEKITPIVLRDGVIEGSGSFKKFSGGERCRSNIAITLAMRHLINSSAPSGGLDLFWIDEITEGLDSTGIENVASSINELGITSILTSHVKHEKNYENVLTATKTNFITKLVK